jgi:phage shock protein A
MATQQRTGLVRRLINLIQGLFATWLADREGERPRAVYERAIAERTRQYAELKSAVAGVLYMRNKLEAEIRERRAEIARTHSNICRAVKRGDDDVALNWITHKDTLLEALQRSEGELEDVSAECDAAKTNLAEFRTEIRALECEKTRMLATLANARARRRIQNALEGLSVDSDMRALESVREQIAQLKAEGNVESELGERGLQARIRSIREEARREGAQRELEELKRRYRSRSLPASEGSLVIAGS